MPPQSSDDHMIATIPPDADHDEVSHIMPPTQDQSTMLDLPVASKINRDFIHLSKNYPKASCINSQTLSTDEGKDRYSQKSTKFEHCVLRNMDLIDCVIRNSGIENCRLVSCCIDVSWITSSSVDTCQVQDSRLDECDFKPDQLVRTISKHRFTFNDVHSLLRNCKLVDSSVQKALISRDSTIVRCMLNASDVFNSNLEGVAAYGSSFESSMITGSTIHKPRLHSCTVEKSLLHLEGLGHEVTTAPLDLKRFPPEILIMMLKLSLLPGGRPREVSRESSTPFTRHMRYSTSRRGPSEDVFRLLVGDTYLYQALLTLCCSGRTYFFCGNGDDKYFPKMVHHIEEVHISECTSFKEFEKHFNRSTTCALPRLRKLVVVGDFNVKEVNGYHGDGIAMNALPKQFLGIAKTWIQHAPLLRELVLEIRSRAPMPLAPAFPNMHPVGQTRQRRFRRNQYAADQAVMPDNFHAITAPVDAGLGTHIMSQGIVQREPKPIIIDQRRSGEDSRERYNWRRMTWTASSESSLSWSLVETPVAPKA